VAKPTADDCTLADAIHEGQRDAAQAIADRYARGVADERARVLAQATEARRHHQAVADARGRGYTVYEVVKALDGLIAAIERGETP